jgi:hypothetical protein
MLQKPIFVYNNWAAYDELSDNVELSETLAMRQLDELDVNYTRLYTG